MLHMSNACNYPRNFVPDHILYGWHRAAWGFGDRLEQVARGARKTVKPWYE